LRIDLLAAIAQPGRCAQQARSQRRLCWRSAERLDVARGLFLFSHDVPAPATNASPSWRHFQRAASFNADPDVSILRQKERNARDQRHAKINMDAGNADATGLNHTNGRALARATSTPGITRCRTTAGARAARRLRGCTCLCPLGIVST